MFSLGEIALILTVVLIFLGPERLPQVARTLGKTLGTLKRVTDDITGQFLAETGLKDTAESIKRTLVDGTGLSEIHDGIREGLKLDKVMSKTELAGILKDIEKTAPNPAALVADLKGTVDGLKSSIEQNVADVKSAVESGWDGAAATSAPPGAQSLTDDLAAAAAAAPEATPKRKVSAKFADDDTE